MEAALAPSFPASFYSIPAQVVWPYMQQWHLDLQQEMPAHIVTTFSYVGSKGTHLGRQRDLNQLVPTPASENPYLAWPADQRMLTRSSINNAGLPNVSAVVNGTPITGQPAINLADCLRE